MTAGKLASINPGATTNTFLYRCPIDRATSSVLNITNTGGSSGTYRVGIRDYDQVVTLDSSSYSFRKGNVVTSYLLEVTPGLQTSSLTPGDLVTLSDNAGSFRFSDILKPTDTVVIPTKLKSIGSATVDTFENSFAVGDTLTGDYGLTALVYAYSDGNLKLEIDNITDLTTTFYVSGDYSINVGPTAGDLLNIDNELMTISSVAGTQLNQLTVTRGSLGTTAAAHLAGSVSKYIRSTINTTTLSADITDTVATTVNVVSAESTIPGIVGSYIRINDEIMLVLSRNVDELTVERGSLGTTASTHTSGDTVTKYTDEGFASLQFFADGETVSNGVYSTTMVVGNSSSIVYSPADKFVYDLSGTGDFSLPGSLTLNIDRTYRFTQEDSSNTDHPLRFSASENGADYSTGVLLNGTPGSAGSYTQISVTSATPLSLYTKCSTDSGEGLAVTINADPFYSEIYVYDVEGEIDNTDAFETNTGSNDVISVTSGPYGYVHDFSGSDLKISLGINSSAFAGSDEFYDTPRTPNSDRAIATVSSVTTSTDINTEDYIDYGTSLNSTTSAQKTSIVVGPGQSIVVYASSGDFSFLLNGFEDNTSDFQVLHYERIFQQGE